ncbi:TIM21 translocase, partial [Polypterus senegalus]
MALPLALSLCLPFFFPIPDLENLGFGDVVVSPDAVVFSGFSAVLSWYFPPLALLPVSSRVIGVFGEPIKGYGETTRRGRRQHVSHVEYMKDGVKHMRLKFYIQGSEPRVEGTVHLEVKENPTSGKFEFCFIFVDIDTYPRRSIVIEDNR